MKEILMKCWEYVVTALAGVSVGAVVTTIVTTIVRAVANKVSNTAQAKINELDTEKLKAEVETKVLAQLKAYTFKQSIAPLVKSELKKIVEVVEEQTEETCGKLDKRLDDIVDILDKFSSYFDNSIGITEDTKAELKQAIENAKTEPTTAEIVFTEEVDEKNETEPVQGDIVAKTKVVR